MPIVLAYQHPRHVYRHRQVTEPDLDTCPESPPEIETPLDRPRHLPQVDQQTSLSARQPRVSSRHRNFSREILDFHTLLTATSGCKLPKPRISTREKSLHDPETERAGGRPSPEGDPGTAYGDSLACRWPPLLGRTPDALNEFGSGHWSFREGRNGCARTVLSIHREFAERLSKRLSPHSRHRRPRNPDHSHDPRIRPPTRRTMIA
jgi:hypothetical protein